MFGIFIALCGSLSPPIQCLLIILNSSPTIMVALSKIILRCSIPSLCTFLPERKSFEVFLRLS